VASFRFLAVLFPLEDSCTAAVVGLAGARKTPGEGEEQSPNAFAAAFGSGGLCFRLKGDLVGDWGGLLDDDDDVDLVDTTSFSPRASDPLTPLV